MESLGSLWTEVVQESETVGDPLFHELVTSAEFNWIFEGSSQEKLKSTLGLINRLLNSPKSRAKGLAVAEKFLRVLDTTYLLHQPESVTSALHLLVKCLDFDLAHLVLAQLLPKCAQVPELNQICSSNIIPKLLGTFCDAGSQSTPSPESFLTLEAAILHFHGPSGQFRAQLEAYLLGILESNDSGLCGRVSRALPLLSRAGGVGPKGDRHEVDWAEMTLRTLHGCFDLLEELYSNAFPNQFMLSFDSGLISLDSTLPPIKENNILNRISAQKSRLGTLSSLLCSYLRCDFPSPKRVPQKSILDLIVNMTSLDPNSVLNKGQKGVVKEKAYLASLLPSIQVMGLQILQELINCTGSNLFVEGQRIENIFSLILGYIRGQRESFEELRIILYKTMCSWIGLTSSIINPKLQSTLVSQLHLDIRIFKKNALTTSNSQSKGRSKVKKGSKGSYTGFPTSLELPLNSEVATAALELLCVLIPSLDPSSHAGIYEILVLTASEIFQNPSIPPPLPYTNPRARQGILECLEQLAKYPNPSSAISISLLVDLTHRGSSYLDPGVAVAASRVRSSLETLLHPISLPLSLPPVPFERVPAQSEVILEDSEQNEIEDGQIHVQTVDSLTQTEEMGTLELDPGRQMPPDGDLVRKIVQEVLSVLPKAPEFQIQPGNVGLKALVDLEVDGMRLKEVQDGSGAKLNGDGGRKRGFEDEGEPSQSKSTPGSCNSKKFRFKKRENEAEESGGAYQINVDEMLKDFVDIPLI